jgi:predicted transcriptional regulator
MERPPLKLENHEAPQMRRSKLEMYMDILKVLAYTGPLKTAHISYKSNFNDSTLKEYMGFLIKQGLVEELTVKRNNKVFAITKRGITVMRYFREPTKEICFVEK